MGRGRVTAVEQRDAEDYGTGAAEVDEGVAFVRKLGGRDVGGIAGLRPAEAGRRPRCRHPPAVRRNRLRFIMLNLCPAN
jgi:hypothetical protein